MKLTAIQIAEKIGAQVIGDEQLVIRSLKPVDELCADCICPVLKTMYIQYLIGMPYAVLTESAMVSSVAERGIPTILVHPVPLLGLAALIDLFYPAKPGPVGIHPTAVVHSDADLHPSVTVGPNAVIEENVSIGADSQIGPGAVICKGTHIGERVRIGPKSVIGYEGFGYIPVKQQVVKIPQVGTVEIGDHVEIGAGVCIDRATLGKTIVGQGSKIDNLVQIGHNAKIGKNVIIAAQVGLAGSTRVGDNAMLGGQAGVADHLSIGENAKVAAKSGVTRNVKTGETVAGYPAMGRWEWLRYIAHNRRKS